MGGEPHSRTSAGMPLATTVFTDGACSGNPGPGGWAWVQPDGDWASGFDPDTTNQRMELTAALGACEHFEMLRSFGLLEEAGYNEQTRSEAVRFWQSWQNPETGRFTDPGNPERLVNEKYVVALLSHMGARPLSRVRWRLVARRRKAIVKLVTLSLELLTVVGRLVDPAAGRIRLRDQPTNIKHVGLAM